MTNPALKALEAKALRSAAAGVVFTYFYYGTARAVSD